MQTIQKEQYNLAEIAARLGIKAHRSGIYHCFRDDLHKNGDRNPSLSIQPNFFNCFACGVKGDVFSLIQEKLGTDFKGACEWLAGGLPTRRLLKPVPSVRQATPGPRYYMLMEHIWKAVKRKELGQKTKSYLAGRGISPVVAQQLGFRDFDYRQLPLFENLGALGLEKEKKLCPSLRLSGLKVPVFGLTYPFPIAWRTRMLSPCEAKEIAPYGVGLPSLPLGLGLGRGKHPVLIIAEGTPDYLSFEHLKHEFNLNYDTWGITSISSGWKAFLTPHLKRYRAVIYAGHDSEPSKDLSQSLATSITSSRWPINFSEHLFSEANDANDMLRRGTLADLVKSLMEEHSHG